MAELQETTGTTRFAQFTYASRAADTGGRGGGWGLQQSSGDPTAEEMAVLEPRVVVAFGSHEHEAAPAFLTPEQRATMPRRFSYALLSGSTAAYCHAVEAGKDATGRENVFNHVIIDRDLDAPSPDLRPIEFWRSPDLLTPFQMKEVDAAVLPGGSVPARAFRTTAQDLVGLAAENTALLCLLLDAVAHAMAGGARVALVAASVDSAARLVGAVSRLMSPATARHFSWSLYERVDDSAQLALLLERGVHLFAVPAVDAESAARREDLVVIRDDEVPSFGWLGGDPHITAAGSRVGVTAWSELAQTVLAETRTAERTVELLDDAVDRVGDEGLALEWPLAVAVVLAGPMAADAAATAGEVLLRSSPSSLSKDSGIYAATVAVIGAATGTSTAEVWAARVAAVEAGAAPLVVELMATSYLERAVEDDAWLSRAEGVPLPERIPGAVGDAFRSAVERRIRSLADASAAPEPATALLALRLLELAAGAGMPPHPLLVEELVAVTVVPVLTSDAGAALVDRLDGTALRPALDPAAAAAAEVIAADDALFDRAAPGEVLPASVVRWLDRGRVGDALALAAASPEVPPAGLVLESAVDHFRRGGAAPGVAAAALLGLLEHHRRWAALPESYRSLGSSAQLTSRALGVLESRHPGELDDEVFLDALATAGWDDDLLLLCSLLDARGTASGLAPIVRLRRRCAPERRDVTAGAETETLTTAARLVHLFGARAALDEWTPHVLEAAFAQEARAVADPASPGSQAAVGDPVALQAFAGASTAPGTAARLRARLSSGADARGRLERYALLAIVTSDGFPPGVASGTARLLAAIPSADGGGRLLDAVIDEALESGRAGSAEELAARVVSRVPALAASVSADQKGLDRRIAEAERIARDWWRSRGVATGRGATTIAGLLGGLGRARRERAAQQTEERDRT